jgi:AbrB family looped-hinge helix DNA binding protein
VFPGAEADYLGSSVIGEKGQLVIPAEVRKRYSIKPGDKFLVLAGERMGAWGFLLVKAEVVSAVIEKFISGEMPELMRKLKEEADRDD